ncbi:hypothetical protein KSX_80870 [Ktedonospora formicarum]|uniref:Reverse transcriptase domain-containing protein n=1 Tax=Ktedonospora formicarum TaxID=2778364 RepID=A0A8J3ID62_9CHLR|nr:hypothetical protein KSX_80870 [Ktedonospora formicarum]
MQQPNALLTTLSKMTIKPEVTFDKLFQKLFNVELWLLAYQRIAPKPGNMTPGIDGETIDGAGLRLIQDAIADLKASRYKPIPVRRVYIPKPNGKQRPLGIPIFRDKLLGTVLKLILEAIYEPTFSKHSHGFRPERSCHTALEAVKRDMNGVRWWVEGDIKGYFDNVNHDTLLRVLSKKITDKRFLHLIGQFLKAGYVEDWRYHQTYSGVPQGGTLSPVLSNIYLNELDMTYNAEVRGFLGYYSLADNLKDAAGGVLWITMTSFFCTLAGKRKSSIKKVIKNLKKGPNRYVISLEKEGKGIKEYELVSSTKQLQKEKVTYGKIDLIPKTWVYQSRNELGKRLLATECEWCGIRGSQVEVHHIRKLGNLQGKAPWERQMIERRRKTMVLCVECHDELHAGTLSEKKKKLRKIRRAGYAEMYKSGSEGVSVKPDVAIH